VAKRGRPPKVAREFSVPDLIGFGFLASFFSGALVDRVLSEAGKLERRVRLLPSRVVVYYVLAMALYASEGYRELFRLLVEGLRSVDPDLPVVVPAKSAFSKARERVGSEPLKRLFEEVAVPLAVAGMPGAFYRSWRLMSVDGSTLEVPDTPENILEFGRPGVSRGERSAFSRLKWLALAELGSRAIVGLEVGAYRESEHKLVVPLLTKLAPGMLLITDRGFYGFELWQQAEASGAELLWRLKKNAVFTVEERLPDGSYLSRAYPNPNARRDGTHAGVPVRIIEYELEGDGAAGGGAGGEREKYRLITSILDHQAAPACELAALYAERWQVELSIREAKVTQGRPGKVLRSRKPDGVLQELYGFACVHYAISWLLNQAALEAGLDPDRLSYVSGLRAVRRKLSRPESFSPHEPSTVTARSQE